MATFARITVLLLAALFAGHAQTRPTNVTDADAPRALDAYGPVAVSWTDPETFTEIRYSRSRFEAVRGDWVRDLAEHLRTASAAALADGERLDVEIIDIDRAGEYEPATQSLGDVRVVRDLYPPSLELRFTLRDAGGQVLAEGERRLTDLGFLTSSAGMAARSDPLQHEKRLIDRWVRDELRAPRR
ncbi:MULTISPECIES: DUF3016 domain-containing protein [unclassified Luteimonas]|uniref:DUF3016 domain-containing protein n=1 Tax=unclassified Luteimonas TaxID=2629088 RepID=UPI0016031C44|nr:MULTISPECIES: DUF3016 domain-containing protein [unclassified Luteimonas]MBB1473019.1 DUF3016 domain-containing protein [Luteimonas sp. MC1782]MBB6598280.1 DUF3016 domain-containing protein [Luteimonas sp. MC1825]QOC88493.1 DUF3016 domain-containing protein [Luteimonas sp. MC1825]